MTQTPEQIAAGLTKAQRALVLASAPDDMTGEEGLGIEIRGAMYRTARSLEELGLGSYTHGSTYYDMYWNLPFGLAVRTILENRNDAG